MSAAVRGVRGRDIRLKTLAILVAVALAVTGSGFWLQYRIAIDRTGVQLTELARAQARLFESVARYDAIHAGPEGGARQRTLSEIREAHYTYRGFGKTGEITLAEKRDSTLHFLLNQPSAGMQIPAPLPMDDPQAALTARAFAGQAGLATGTDYHGKSVLEAYEYLPFLDVALGAKMEIAEIRAPLIRQAAITLLVGLVVIAIGIGLHGRLVGPLIAQLVRELKVAQTLAEEARRGHELALVGESIAVRALREQIDQCAGTSAPVLLGGPPGSGQESVARAIHERSARASSPFIVLDCSRPIGDDTTPLLGISRGGATGKLSVANGGTIYLDLITFLPMEIQESLARVIRENAVTRARGGTPQQDVRVVAYMQADPHAAMANGDLHPSLGEALGKHRIVVPSLTERRDDIVPIALRVLQARARTLGKSALSFSPRATKSLERYDWPGNIRELQNVVERSVLMSTGVEVDIEDDLRAQSRSVGGYRLIRLLGRGGMGEVWLAEHALLKRPAAVKLTLVGANTAPNERAELERRFRREAEVTAQLRSPHTVELYDFGVTEDGTFYYVMELLEGLDLGELVRRVGVVPPDRAAYLMRQACLSLGEAHELGLIHRDIKPENLFACRLGQNLDFLKVLDFGIVKRTETGDTGNTRTGMIIGTPAYIAPEVATGGAPSAQSDIYALGCVLYRLVTGRNVFEEASTMAMLVAHVERAPDPPSKIAAQPISPDVDRLIMRCLAKNPADRPASAKELRFMLEDLEFGVPWSERRAADWWRSYASSNQPTPLSPPAPPIAQS